MKDLGFVLWLVVLAMCFDLHCLCVAFSDLRQRYWDGRVSRANASGDSLLLSYDRYVRASRLMMRQMPCRFRWYVELAFTLGRTAKII